MKITVSGKEFDVEEGITVSRLMEQLSIETPQYVTVAVNKAFQPMERYDCHALQEGDRVEFLYYMGGGAMALTGEQLERYSRHIILKEVGLRGQKKLLNAKVLIIGAGGLGSPAAMYLAAAGVGTIGIADADEVDLSNLQRQILHSAADVGKPKTDSARETIEALNPDVQVNTHHLFVSAENIMELIEPYDFVIDGTDNFAAKFLINDACVLAEKPFCHAGIIRFFGQLMTYVPGKGPCYRCIFRQPPPPDAVPTCRQAGVIGAMAGVIGCMQALEAVKFIVGAGDLLTGRLLTFDALDMEAHVIQLSENPDCAVCGAHPTILAPFDEGAVECDLK